MSSNFIRWFWYSPPKFNLVEFDAQIWAKAPHDLAVNTSEVLLRAPYYRVRLARPNLVDIEVKWGFADELSKEPLIHIGCERLVTDGKNQFELHHREGQSFLDPCADRFEHMKAHSLILSAIDVSIFGNGSADRFIRSDNIALRRTGATIYSRRSEFLDDRTVQYLLINNSTHLPEITSVCRLHDNVEVLKCVFSNWRVDPQGGAKLFEIPVAR